MGMEVKQGTVSRVQNTQTVSGRVHGGRGHVKTKHKTTFSIDQQAAQFDGPGGDMLENGDAITAVGEAQGDGVFYVSAFRNQTSGVTKGRSPFMSYFMGVLCVLLGLLTWFLIITPLLFIPLGLMAIWGGYKNQTAWRLLDTATS